MPTPQPTQRPEMYNPLVLAYLGDAAYELYVRSHLVTGSALPVRELHRKAKGYVSAAAQSKIFAKVEPMLTEQELAIYKRGRNANSPTSAKNADITDYRRATGLEAVFGFLYLKGEIARLEEIMEKVLED